MIRWRIAHPRVEYRRLTPERASGERLRALPPDAALDCLRNVVALLTHCNVDYWITYGTLLGFVREGGFIAHDNDLDFATVDGVDVRALIGAAPAFGLEACVLLLVDDRPRVLKLRHASGIYSDLFLLTPLPHGFGDISLYEGVVQLCRHPPTRTQSVDFQGVAVRAPADAEAHIAALYGRNWRTPRCFWHWSFSARNTIRYEGPPLALLACFRDLWFWRARVLWRRLTFRLE